MQIFNPHFDISFECFVFGLGLFAFQSISLGLNRTFFIGGGMDCTFLRLRGVLPWICVELPRNVLRRLTRDIVPILYSASPFHQLCRVEEYSKTAFVQLVL